MKNVYLIIVMMSLTVIGFGQTNIVTQGFETDQDGYSHSPSQTPSSDPGDQYFYRAEPSDPSIYENSAGPYTNVTGSWLFVGSNPNTINSGNPGILSMDAITVTGYSDLEFHADFGACDNDWDLADDLKVEYNFDGSSWLTLFYFNAPVTNNPLVLTANATGGVNTANGTVLTYNLTTISSDNFTGSGNTLNIRIVCDAGANYEAFGVDNIQIKGIASGGIANPTSFTSTVNSTTQIDLSWVQNGNSNDVLVAWSSGGTFGTPTNGNTYSSGDLISGGGTVVYNGSATGYNHTPLSSGTQYYYSAWSVDGSSDYSSGVTDDATTYKDQPSNHLSTYSVGTVTATSIPTTWSDNDGSVVADGYLIRASTSSTFSDPADGTAESDDTDMSDGSGLINVVHGTEAYTWTGLSQSTQYYFKAWPYTNSGSNINYKLDGTVPTTNGTTITANLDLIISEVTDPNDTYQAKFVEIHDLSGLGIDFSSETWYFSRQANGGSWSDIQLTGTIAAGGTYTLANSQSNFNTAYGFDPDMADGTISGNGDDAYFLYYDGDHSTGTLVDIYGVINQDGTGMPWEYTNSKAVRKRSVSSPASVWSESEWVIAESANVVNMTPGKAFGSVVWRGTTDSDWNTKTNWDIGFIPDVSMNVSIPTSSNNPVLLTTSYAHCWNLDVNSGASLTINSDASGQGTLICNGTSSGDVSIECYTSSGQWHGIATPVVNQTANAFYLSGSPNVWLKEYNESANSYDNVTDLGTSLGTARGWMLWIENGASNHTYTFTGALYNATVTPSGSIVRSQAGEDYGYNFIGNPFSSAIDWKSSAGWTKTNIEDAIYVYNNGNWASYVGGSGTNGGSQNIAMNQGFFVQVKNDGSTSGTMSMTKDVQVHNSVGFMKQQSLIEDYTFIRLNLMDGNLSDETIIRLTEDATSQYDSEMDARKLFSLNKSYPQIYSTLDSKFSINSLPFETGSISVDVTGVNDNQMTISLSETNNADQVYLIDELTGSQVDLTKNNYSFNYDDSFVNRFTVHLGVVDVDEIYKEKTGYSILGKRGKVEVYIPENDVVDIEIYSIMGMKLISKRNCSGIQTFNLNSGNYYIVKLNNSVITQSELVIIN
jgi:hypothetical protein